MHEALFLISFLLYLVFWGGGGVIPVRPVLLRSVFWIEFIEFRINVVGGTAFCVTIYG